VLNTEIGDGFQMPSSLVENDNFQLTNTIKKSLYEPNELIFCQSPIFLDHSITTFSTFPGIYSISDDNGSSKNLFLFDEPLSSDIE
jgi:hypothetical protein